MPVMDLSLYRSWLDALLLESLPESFFFVLQEVAGTSCVGLSQESPPGLSLPPLWAEDIGFLSFCLRPCPVRGAILFVGLQESNAPLYLAALSRLTRSLQHVCSPREPMFARPCLLLA